MAQWRRSPSWEWSCWDPINTQTPGRNTPKNPKNAGFFLEKNYQVSKGFGFTEKKTQKFRNPWQMRTMDVFNWLDHQQPSLARQLFCKNFQVDAPDGTVFPYWVQQQSSPQCSPIVLKPMEIPPLQWSWLIYLQKPQKSRTYQKNSENMRKSMSIIMNSQVSMRGHYVARWGWG